MEFGATGVQVRCSPAFWPHVADQIRKWSERILGDVSTGRCASQGGQSSDWRSTRGSRFRANAEFHPATSALTGTDRGRLRSVLGPWSPVPKCEAPRAPISLEEHTSVAPSTTVVDRALAALNRAFGSGSTWLGIDVVFATGTNAADVQVRAIPATAFR